MDENRKEELLTLWMDDGLSSAEREELAPYLAKHPELEAEREEYVRLRDELRSVLPEHVEPPYPEFFNKHLMRQIREEERMERIPAVAEVSGMWSWMRYWMVPAAAAAVVVAFLAGKEMGDRPAGAVATTSGAGYTGELAPGVYSAISSVDVTTWEDPDAGSTVIVLDGLEDIPSSVDLLKTTASLEEGEGSGKTF
ncbi:MAG: hypothetical protein OSA48_05240 [Akkermansiaceae bacterium]|nr:hypothetical protein [Akkermansiaceae bacterium]